MKMNDVILRTVVKVVIFIILTLGVYLFFSGHNAPGGGFIGGLVSRISRLCCFMSRMTSKRFNIRFPLILKKWQHWVFC